MTIVEVSEPSRIRIDLVFEKPCAAHDDTAFTIDLDGTGSRVTWTMTGRETLATRVMGLVRSMDAMVGPDFAKGLTRLRAAVEPPAGA